MTKTKKYSNIHFPLPELLYLAEFVWLIAMVIAFWHHSPPIRDNWVGLVLLAVPIYMLRWLELNRLWRRTRFDIWFVALIVLTAISYEFAPTARQNYWVIVCRPLLGIFIVQYMVTVARRDGFFKLILWATVGQALIFGGLGLTSVQWEAGKSDIFQPVLDSLPVLDTQAVLPDMLLRFNPNELAGLLAYLCPLMAGFALYRSNSRFLRGVAGVGFLLTLAGLMLGQSRFAIAGVLLGLAVLILFGIPQVKWRVLALGLVGGLVALQVVIFIGPTASGDSSNEPSATVSVRDQNTLNARFQTWESALRMMGDYPLTGIGLANFRTGANREAYRIPYYVARETVPPHAHNEWLQMGADIGVGGVIVFAGLYLTTIWMMWLTWQVNMGRLLVLGVGGGLLAHFVYGLGDAIPLWDRGAFLYWWCIGLCAMLYQRFIVFDAELKRET